MATLSDTQTVPTFLVNALSASTGLDVWEDSVPRGGILPAIIFKMQGPGREVDYVPYKRSVTESVWQVVVIDQTTYYSDTLTLVAKQIDDALQGAFASNVNGQDVISCRRTGMIRMPDDTDIPHRKLGGLYRVQIVDHA